MTELVPERAQHPHRALGADQPLLEAGDRRAAQHVAHRVDRAADFVVYPDEDGARGLVRFDASWDRRGAGDTVAR